ncbi:MAG: DinB family protein [Flavobacteriales bacterium]|nr:DinB family protein [Flavobacteriales bacterium]
MRPDTDEYPGYYEPFIGLVKTSEIVAELRESGDQIVEFLSSISEEQGNYNYAPDKWSIKAVILHMIDTERIYTYRALRFARNDSEELPGFDENQFANNSFAEKRSMETIIAEFKAVRNSTIALFENLDSSTLTKKGKANGHLISVRAIAHILAGHALHHCNIIRERYL